MKYVDLAKLPESPTSAISEFVALNDEGKIIKANTDDFATKQDLEDNEQVVSSAVNDLNERLENLENETKYFVTGGTKRYSNNILELVLNYKNVNGVPKVQYIELPNATETKTGLFSPDLYARLNHMSTGDTATQVVWGANSNMNNYTTAGIYNITGERLNASDNLPILNSNPGHTIAARLYVLDSSISGNGASDDKCITQVLMLSNRVGGDGNVYVRTGQGSSISNLTWEQWGTLQQNINVGTITSYGNLIDNGIYSGVYTNGSTIFDTFVMVVINNYAVAGKVGAERTISQFLYVTHIDGSVEFLRRTNFKYNDGSLGWYSWKGLFNNSQYISNLLTAPNMDNITKQVLKFTNTDFSVPIGTLNNLFYNHIKNLFISNNYKQIEVFAETTRYNEYNSGNGNSSKIYAEIHCYATDNLYKKYQKIVVGFAVGSTTTQGVKVIQDIDIA